MSAIGNVFPSLVDAAKRMDPDGTTADIAELLKTNSPLIGDMVWKEGNLPNGHQSTSRTGLPQGTWRMMYEGVTQSKSTTAQVVDLCGNLEGYSDVDKDVADLNGNTSSFLMSEDTAFLEGLSQQATTALIYASGDTSPEKLTGIMPRFNTVTLANAATAANVIDAQGSGSDNCSILLIGHGPTAFFGIFPKGKKAGLQRQFKGQQTLYDAAGKPFEGYRTHYKWELGMAMPDWRYVARAANIDVSDLAGVSPAILSRLFTRMIGRLPALTGSIDKDGNMVGVKPVFYVPRVLWTWANIQAQEKTNMGFTNTIDAQGGPVTSFQNVPLKILDQLLTTEARVT